MNKTTCGFLSLVIPVVLQSCFAQNNREWNDYAAGFDRDFREELASGHVTGASYAVFDTATVILSGTFGLEDRSEGDSVRPTTRFLIGSVTKVFTAVAVMQLYEDGQLDIDAPLREVLPELEIRQRFPGSPPMTVRDVLTHHAGLPGDVFVHKFSGNPPPYSGVLPYLNSHPTCAPVGRIKSYSNLGYCLLGLLVERISGLPYTEYIREHIFLPLGMNNSGFYLTTDQEDSISTAYDRSGNAARELPIFDVPAGGIWSDLPDMNRFARCFIRDDPGIMNKKTRDMMFELQNRDVALDLDDRSAICFDFRNKALQLGRTLEHGGATLYHRAQLYIAADAGLGAVMLSNAPDGVLNAWKLHEQFMAEYASAHNFPDMSDRNQEKPFAFTSLEDKDLRSFAGDYAMPGMLCSFSWQDDHLKADIQDNSFYLVPEDEHSFVPAKKVMGKMRRSRDMWFFLEEIDGEHFFIQAMPWGDLVIIGTMVDKNGIPDAWKSRTGRYEAVNLDQGEIQMIRDIEIAEHDGFLVLRYRYNEALGNARQVEMGLDITGDREAFTMGLGRGGGESVVFDRVPETGQVMFEYYGLRCRRVED